MTAVISGATKGIGRAIAEMLGSKGFDLIICARNASELESCKLSIEQDHQIKVQTFVADLSLRKDTLAFADFIKQHCSTVEILVNNAGSYVPGGVLSEEDGALEKMINTNLYSAYHLTRALHPHMDKKGKAYIFNICSIASLHAYPNGGAYSISKFALYGFSKNLREELKNENIRVCSILPGATMSDSWAGSGVSEDRIMEAKDIAKALWTAYDMSPKAVVEDIILRPQLGDL